jgi:hypothetical protein
VCHNNPHGSTDVFSRKQTKTARLSPLFTHFISKLDPQHSAATHKSSLIHFLFFLKKKETTLSTIHFPGFYKSYLYSFHHPFLSFSFRTMSMNDNNFIPTDWLSLTITKKASHIAEDGTLKASIAGQRGAHLIELLPEDNDAPWGTKDDDLYSKVQLSCQIDVKGRLSIDEREGIKGLVELTVVVEEWRLVTSLSPVLDGNYLTMGKKRRDKRSSS